MAKDVNRWLSGKESTCQAGDAGDVGSIPSSGRSHGGENGDPLLVNPMDRGAWHATIHSTQSDTSE